MNYDENLTYDWLRELRQKKLKLLKEEERDPNAPPGTGSAEVVSSDDTGRGQNPYSTMYKASDKYPNKAAKFGDFTYKLKNASDPSIEIIDSNLNLRKVGSLFCTKDQKDIKADILFQANYIPNLQNAYKAGSTRYCPNPDQGYSARVVKGPGYNNLPVNQRGLSNHAFGSAIDFNAIPNDFIKGRTGEIENYPEFIQAFLDNGFEWLGDGRGGTGVGDDMHFQIKINTSPQEQAMEMADSVGSTPQAQGLPYSGGARSYASNDWYEPFRQKDFLNLPDDETSSLEESDKLLSKKEKNKKISIKNKSKHKELSKNKELLIDMLSYFGKKLKFDKPVKINFIEDSRNSNKPLGKTAYYYPEEHEITVFTTGRLLKDILRSIGHELIHHKQHCNQPFDMSNHQEGYAQKDKSMRKREKEAYLYGNILFRDWEDSYKKKNKGVS